MTMNIPVYLMSLHTSPRGAICSPYPVLASESVNHISGAEVYFKCENFQKVGAFKFRGAMNAVMSLSNEEVRRGVCTHSSGNHAAALALSARNRGVDAYVVMPENAPEIKKKAVAGYGAKITFCEPTLESRESAVETIIVETGATEIHPYDNFDVIAGQGTAAKEMLEDETGFDLILVPVGGGGLLAGSALSVKHLSPGTKVIGCEPDGADDAYRSFLKGKDHSIDQAPKPLPMVC